MKNKFIKGLIKLERVLNFILILCLVFDLVGLLPSFCVPSIIIIRLPIAFIKNVIEKKELEREFNNNELDDVEIKQEQETSFKTSYLNGISKAKSMDNHDVYVDTLLPITDSINYVRSLEETTEPNDMLEKSNKLIKEINKTKDKIDKTIAKEELQKLRNDLVTKQFELQDLIVKEQFGTTKVDKIYENKEEWKQMIDAFSNQYVKKFNDRRFR